MLNNEIPLIAGLKIGCKVINRYYHLKFKACNDTVFTGFHKINSGFEEDEHDKAKDHTGWFRLNAQNCVPD